MRFGWRISEVERNFCFKIRKIFKINVPFLTKVKKIRGLEKSENLKEFATTLVSLKFPLPLDIYQETKIDTD